ncbi:MAG: oxidase [Alphaproteobacteria bacterium]|nr:oxidase [Alphaproteobacteria bacterium]
MAKKMNDINLNVHHVPKSFSDHIAYRIVKLLRFFADCFFTTRYGHRAVVLETVAGVPGMVGGMLQHLKSLRLFKDDGGRIKVLLEEAENERMHLMTFIEIAHPNWIERALIVIAQILFFGVYFLLYILSPRTSHRLVSYMEEEAVYSYTQYLHEVESGKLDNVPVPPIAVKYWNLDPDAKLADLIVAVRRDEAHHRDQNNQYANE